MLPVHNVADHLPAALTSLRMNAEPDYEFVFVDDGSTDATPELIDDARAVLPGVRVIRHEKPRGAGDARNACIAAATGRYLTFVDGDDWLASGYLPALVDSIERLGCDFVRTDHVQVFGRERVVKRAPEARRERVLDPRSGILPVARQTMVDYPFSWAGIYHERVRRLMAFPGHLHSAEDRDWIWRLHREADSYAVVSLAGLFYRRLVPGSMTQVGDERQLDFLRAYPMVFAQLRDEPDRRLKAVRQFVGVCARQVDMQQRLTPELRDRMQHGIGAALAQVSRDDLRALAPYELRLRVLRPFLSPQVQSLLPPLRDNVAPRQRERERLFAEEAAAPGSARAAGTAQ